MVEKRLSNMTEQIAAMQDLKLYRELHWEGGFEEYLGIVREKPQVTRPVRDPSIHELLRRELLSAAPLHKCR